MCHCPKIKAKPLNTVPSLHTGPPIWLHIEIKFKKPNQTKEHKKP